MGLFVAGGLGFGRRAKNWRGSGQMYIIENFVKEGFVVGVGMCYIVDYMFFSLFGYFYQFYIEINVSYSKLQSFLLENFEYCCMIIHCQDNRHPPCPPNYPIYKFLLEQL